MTFGIKKGGRPLPYVTPTLGDAIQTLSIMYMYMYCVD